MPEVQKFDYNDKVFGFIDGFGMRHGYVIDIDPESDWPYMIRTTDGDYCVFTEEELEVWDDRA